MLAALSVTSFLSQINDLILGEYAIEGEVSQYKVSQNKWVFFDLKDETGVLGCFSTVFMLHQPIADGMKVRVFGYPKIYEKTGKFSFTVQRAELVGEGSLKKAFLLLKEKLEKEGLFALERKRALPDLPERIGVIASRDSAAWGDFRRILANRWGAVELVMRHVNVQGAEAVGDILAAFDDFSKYPDHLDALVLIRGGGSLEDLAAFNDEAVVRAIYASRIPVVTGIGHERDDTLADYVADVRCSTPSNAAERIVPDYRDVLGELEYQYEFIISALKQGVALQRERIRAAEYALSTAAFVLVDPCARLVARFESTFERLRSLYERYQERVAYAERLMAQANPERLLRQGYSLAFTDEGALIRSAAAIKPGDVIRVRTYDGSYTARTETVENKKTARR